MPVRILFRGPTRCAHLHIRDRRNEVDALIAATALVHGLTVVTRNGRDFTGSGVVCGRSLAGLTVAPAADPTSIAYEPFCSNLSTTVLIEIREPYSEQASGL